jgi:glutathione S-transferase
MTMDLYFAPLACSLATRIALYEAGADDARYLRVDTHAKRLADGSDFLAITLMGQVPVLRTDQGTILTENTAVLQYVADRFPQAGLAPTMGLERARLQQWLGFIGTELHKAIFIPLLDANAPEGAKTYAREKIALRFGLLEKHLANRELLLDRFSVADAYLATVLNWAAPVGVDLTQWPAVAEYHRRLLQRPSVAKAVGEEWRMYQEEQARQAAAVR